MPRPRARVMIRYQSAARPAGCWPPRSPVYSARRNDLVGVNVGTFERDGATLDDADRFHESSSGEAKRPMTALAAATAGDTRCVRPPRPWRPSKFRFDVEAQRISAPS